ncbi:MAG: hypothetical protein JNK04_10805 [Myxococcales bacterium]|nr:hypothetical protein [Myxococcales bacterium]
MANEDELSARKTLAMGRDTVVDPRRPQGPRGTQLMPHGEVERQIGAAQVVKVGTAKVPEKITGRKVDVSGADPRHRRTNVVPRKPNRYVPPDRGTVVGEQEAAGSPRWLIWLGAASLVALVLCVIAFVWFVKLRESGRL